MSKEEEKEIKETKTSELKEENSLKFQNIHIDYLLSIIDFPAHGEVLRNRNRFLKLVRPRAIEIENERNRLLEELTPKDRDGKPKKKIDPMSKELVYDLSDEGYREYQKKWKEFMKEDFIIDILPSNKAIISAIKEMIKNTNRDMDLSQGEVYEQICEVFGIN